MDLTPIRVPGKRKRGQEFPARRVPVSVSRKRRTLKSLKPRRKMSILERLPTELLEEIFLYCMNLNLPRASPIIAAKLSREAFYHKTIISAFGRTWYKNYCLIPANGSGRLVLPTPSSDGYERRARDCLFQVRLQYATLYHTDHSVDRHIAMPLGFAFYHFGEPRRMVEAICGQNMHTWQPDSRQPGDR